jgi:hypothetical protein
VLVAPAAFSRFAVTGFPSPITAGTPGTFTVTAEDAYSNVIARYPGTVHFTSSDPQASLPADYTFLPGDAGSHTFTATLFTAGTQSLTATDTTSGVTGSQTNIMVTAGALDHLIVSGFPSPTTAGTAGTVTVTAADIYGNTVTGYMGTVHFTSTDAKADLPTDYTFTAADNGTHTFSATLKTAATQSITATDTLTGSVTGTQSGIVVNPAAASSFVVAGFPSPIKVGTAGTFTVTAMDAYGNIATSYTGKVHFTSSDTQAALPGDYTFTASDNGIHTFGAVLYTVGTQSITATDTVDSTITGTQAGIVVTASSVPGTGLVPAVTDAPATAVAGSPAGPETTLPPAPPTDSPLPLVVADMEWTAAVPTAAQDRLFADFDSYLFVDPVGV